MARPHQPSKKKELLREAAILLAQDRIDPGEPGSWHEHLGGNPKKILGAMAIATYARERAGSTHVCLTAGEVAVHNVTSTGAHIATTTAPRKSDTDPLQFAAIIGDAKGPIEGMAIRLYTQPDEPSSYEVTDRLGMVVASVTASTINLVLGTPVIDESEPLPLDNPA